MKKVLVVAPHADDEVLGVGGTIAKNAAQGNEVYVCVVTRAEEPLFSKTVAEQIREETLRAHKLLGIKKAFFLEFPAVMLENIERYILNDSIMKVLQEINPDEVYIPHMGDMQKDHQIVNEAVMVAVRPKYRHVRDGMEYTQYGKCVHTHGLSRYQWFSGEKKAGACVF